MKKTVTITTHNQDIGVLADALRLKNEFLTMGFATPRSFVRIVTHYLPELADKKSVALLNRWWSQSLKDAELNDRLDVVLNKLKTE